MTIHSRKPKQIHAILCFGIEKAATPEEIEQFTTGLLEIEYIHNSLELDGVFDFMSEAVFPNVAAYHDTMRDLERQGIIRTCEASLVCKEFVQEETDEALWIKDGHEDGTQVRIGLHEIEKIVAEGDYMRIFAEGREWLYHCTLAHLSEQLGSRVIRLNRSTLVRSDFITRIRHVRDKWEAHLKDGSTCRISRPHVKDVIDHTSSTEDVDSSKNLIARPQFSNFAR
ncbi:MAG: LytTR family transcriptional regulator [Erythrobacter sp.]|nr:LytTR family transcriptional regulator [Erythrobacter sp.]